MYVDKDEHYDSLKAEYEEEIKECKDELDEIIATESEIKGYDFSKHLKNMTYEELMETYLPELLKPIGNKRSPAKSLIVKMKVAEDYLEDLEEIHENNSAQRWWFNFSN